MSLPEIRDEWGVPARPGQRVSIRYPLIDDDGYLTPVIGTITGADDGRLVVTPDPGGAWTDVFRAHPTQLRYLTEETR